MKRNEIQFCTLLVQPDFVSQKYIFTLAKVHIYTLHYLYKKVKKDFSSFWYFKYLLIWKG